MDKKEMSIIKKLLSKDVKKPTALTHFMRDLSESAQKLMTIIVLHCQNFHKEEDNFYYIRKLFIKKFLVSENTKNIATIQNAFDELYEKSFDWNFLDEDMTFQKLKSRFLTDLATPNDRGHYYAYQINPNLEKVIKDPKVFGKLKIIMVILLVDNKYSYSLYEFVADAYSRGKRSIKIFLDDLKKYLGVEGIYKEFIDFKKRVLNPGIEEINQKSDYNVTYKTYRESRKITGIVFDIEKKHKWQPPVIEEFIQEMKRYYEVKEPILLTESNLQETLKEDEKEVIIKDLSQYDISEKDTLRFIEIHGLEGVIEIRNYALLKHKKSKKDDFAAYIATCLREGYGKKNDEERKKDTQKRTSQETHQRRKQLKDLIRQLEDDVDTQRNETLKTLKEKLSPEQLERYELEFKTRIDNDEYNSFIKSAYYRGGAEGAGAKISFNGLLKDKLLSTKIEDVRKYAQSKGYNYDELKKELELLEAKSKN